MEVIRAKRAGACYGVQRALDIADEVIADGAFPGTLGLLIHNPQVGLIWPLAAPRPSIPWRKSAGKVPRKRALLRKEPLVQPRMCRRWSSAPTGVTPQVLAAVKTAGFPWSMPRCPHVSRAQHAAAELAAEGCCVIVVGEAGHPKRLTAWAEEAGGKVDVVAAPEEIPRACTIRGRGGPDDPAPRELGGGGGRPARGGA